MTTPTDRGTAATTSATAHTTQQPDAWGLYANVEGTWVLQHPVRYSKAEAEQDVLMYADDVQLEARPLFSTDPADLRKQRDELLQALKALSKYDTYETEYAGQTLHLCPSCGTHNGDHGDHCEFARAAALIARVEARQ